MTVKKLLGHNDLNMHHSLSAERLLFNFLCTNYLSVGRYVWCTQYFVDLCYSRKFTKLERKCLFDLLLVEEIYSIVQLAFMK